MPERRFVVREAANKPPMCGATDSPGVVGPAVPHLSGWSYGIFPVMSAGFRFLFLLLLLGRLAAPAPVLAADKFEPSPSEWKAITLRRSLSLVTWPTNSFATTNSPLVIGILEPDPFGRVLEEFFKGEKLNSRKVVVKKFEDPAEAANCQVLFVPASQVDKWRAADKSALPKHLLVIGDSKGFAKNDGAFNLVFEKKLLQINMKAAKKAGVAIDGRLQRMADTRDL